MKQNIDNNIIVAISAAITSMEERSGYKLVVKSFKRIPRISPVWSSIGRIERIRKSL